jgi:hypothetical protein
MTVDSSKRNLNRRQFLRLTGAAIAVAVPALFGYGLMRDAQGELPVSASPYAVTGSAARLSSRVTLSAPLLLLTNEKSNNPFGPYLAEVLRAEGLNCFQIADLSTVDRAVLAEIPLLLLAEGPLDNAQTELLQGYVSGGGRLVAMRPDASLALLFGLERMTDTTAEGYLSVETGHRIGQGVISEALQFHGTADHYRLAGAQVVAWLLADAEARRTFPAVTLHRYGQGQAALWAFDLARSVAYTRQGNPAWVGQERDGRDGLRMHDAFVGWVDLDRMATPQADEQMRLLSRLISEMLSDALPLPRLWYFPGAAETMLIATGDSHANPAAAIEEVLTRVEQRGGHMTVYYAPPLTSDWRRAARKVKGWASTLPLVDKVLTNPTALPSPSNVADWRVRGHEFALHPYVEEGLEAGWQRYWREFTGLGYGPVPPTVRTHRVLWQGWVESARVQAAYGLRMNLDSYHIGPAFRKEDGEWAYGHFTGSGLPMKFVDAQGRILNIYQQLTQLVDEHLLQVPWGGHVKMSGQAAVEVSRQVLQRSLQGDFSAIAAQFHVDPFAVGEDYAVEAAKWLEGTLDYAALQGIPIWSAEEWLHFTEIRHDANLENVQWNPIAGRLSFQLVAQTALDIELAVMMPMQHGKAQLIEVKLDGHSIAHRERIVGGARLGWVTVGAGSHQVVATYS